jgi:hypothetical protein
MKFRSRSGISPKSSISAAASGFQARMSWVGVITIAGRVGDVSRTRCICGLIFCGARRRDVANAASGRALDSSS